MDLVTRVATIAGTVIAVSTAFGVLGGRRLMRWVARHLAEDLSAAFTAPLHASVATLDERLGRIETLAAQLEPNGGASMHDRLTMLVGRLDAWQAEHDYRMTELWELLHDHGIERRRPSSSSPS